MATCTACGAEASADGRCPNCAEAPLSAAGELRTEEAVRAWSPDAPGATRALDDSHLLDYRHPNELPALWISVGVAAVIVLAIFLLVNPGVALGILGAWATTVVATFVQAAKLIGNAGEVTPTQFSHLYPMVDELRQRFAMPRTRVFVLQSPVLNAFAFGFKEPYAVVLHSALVDALDEQELKSILGHEMGHVKFGHTRLGALFGGLHAAIQLPFPLNLVIVGRRLLFLWWRRALELSADRAGVVASRRPSKMISSLVKLGVGPTMYRHVNIDDLARQAADLRQGWWRLWGFLGQVNDDHPFQATRIQAIVDFVGAPEPRHARVPTQSPRSDEVLPPRPEPPRDSAPLAVLAVRRGPTSGHTYPLDGRIITVGRAPENDLPIDDGALSRRHFQIGWVDSSYRLEDLGSSNGTRVNGSSVQAVQLKSGDRIRAGNLELEFRLAL